METLPPQTVKPIAKTNILFAVAGLALLGAAYYFYNKNKKTAATKATAATNAETKTDAPKTSDTNTTPVVSSIAINNANLNTSPLIGQYHITAVIGLVSPPVSGTLQVFVGGQEVDSVALPISGNSYILDKYVVINNPENPQTLLAKIGTITKSVQVQA